MVTLYSCTAASQAIEGKSQKIVYKTSSPSNSPSYVLSEEVLSKVRSAVRTCHLLHRRRADGSTPRSWSIRSCRSPASPRNGGSLPASWGGGGPRPRQIPAPSLCSMFTLLKLEIASWFVASLLTVGRRRTVQHQHHCRRRFCHHSRLAQRAWDIWKSLWYYACEC